MLQPLPDPDATSFGEEAFEKAKLAFVDVETTGLDPDWNEVWEVALILGDEEKHWFLDVDLDRADPDALRISGFYERHPRVLAEKDDGSHDEVEIHPKDVVARWLARLTSGAHLVGVNPAFDATFLGSFIRTNGQVPTWHYHLIDVLPLVAGRHRLVPPWNSKELSRIAQVPTPAGKTKGAGHSALEDARWAKALYEAVLG